MEVNIPSDMHRNSSALRDRRPQSLTSEPLQAKFESPRWFSGARRSALLLLAGGVIGLGNYYYKHAFVSSPQSVAAHQADVPAVKSLPVKAALIKNMGDEPLLNAVNSASKFPAYPILYKTQEVDTGTFYLLRTDKSFSSGAVCYNLHPEFAQWVLVRAKKYREYGSQFVFQGLFKVGDVDEMLGRLNQKDCSWAIVNKDQAQEIFQKLDATKIIKLDWSLFGYDLLRVTKAVAKRVCDTTGNKEQCDYADWTPYVPPEMQYDKWKKEYLQASTTAMLTLLNIHKVVPGAAESCRMSINQDIKVYSQAGSEGPEVKRAALATFRDTYQRCTSFTAEMCQAWGGNSDVRRACDIYDRERNKNFKVHT